MPVAGCAGQGRFKNDPRAAVVGPDYLDYIEQYPMDRETRYHYPPRIGFTGAKGVEAPSVDGPSSFTAKVQALMTLTAKVPPAVQKTDGIGWAKLERQGIAL